MSKVAFISLGCDKNLVDSQVMLGLISKAGFTIVTAEEEADLIIINTCCFIKDALNESIETIIEVSKYKEHGNCKGIIVTGCLAERYKNEFFESLPEVSAIVGVKAYEGIAGVLKDVLSGKRIARFEEISTPCDENLCLEREGGASHLAYLKISEGCNNRCTYCIIPSLRGPYISRSIESLIKEAEELAKNGTRELMLVAQDTGYYGVDIYGERKLYELLDKLCEIEDLDRIRVLYCYPENINDELIEVMSRQNKICNYLDMPIQHASDSVLKRMGRKTDIKSIEEKIRKLREKIPDISIRTSLITGFPGETEEDFEKLLKFVERIRFDRLGVFAYSREDGTPAAKLPSQIPARVKNKRRNAVMRLQKKISAGKNREFLNKTFEIMVDGKISDENIYIGRSFRDAPDIDGLTFFESFRELLSGDIVNVKITKTGDYDLTGEEVYESGE